MNMIKLIEEKLFMDEEVATEITDEKELRKEKLTSLNMICANLKVTVREVSIFT